MYARPLGATGAQDVQVGGGILASTIPILAPLVGIGGPVGAAIAAAVGGISALLGAFGVGSGCGSSCIQASNDANQIEQALKANLAAFLAGQISQSDAEATYQQLWGELQSACAQIPGAAGQNCIGDRQSGACKYKTSPGGWQGNTYVYPGANGSGQTCWNWAVGYSDPITQAPASFTAQSSFPWSNVLLLGGLGLGALAIAEAF